MRLVLNEPPPPVRSLRGNCLRAGRLGGGVHEGRYELLHISIKAGIASILTPRGVVSDRLELGGPGTSSGNRMACAEGAADHSIRFDSDGMALLAVNARSSTFVILCLLG